MQPQLNLTHVPLPVDLLIPQATVTIAARTCLLEGPAFDGAGHLFFSDIIGNHIYRMTPDGALSIYRADSGRTNGNTFDAHGFLISCEGAEFGPGGRRRMVRTDLKSDRVEVLTDRFEGKRYNSPNDVVVDVKGRIWFTDPFYGDDRTTLEMDAEAVYRIDADGMSHVYCHSPRSSAQTDSRSHRMHERFTSSTAITQPGGNRKVWSFAVDDAGRLSNQRLIFDFGRGRGGDGMRLDEQGNLWVAAGISLPRHVGETADVPAGIYVITPNGS